MRRFATGGRRAALGAVAVLVVFLSGCDSQPAGPELPRPRVFRAAMADGQILPAHRACPAPVAGMITGTNFVEGELVLYPERTFTWRYTIQQYARVEGTQQAWTEPFTVRGSYVLRGDSLDLTAVGGARYARVLDDALQLVEVLPCPYPVPGQEPPSAALDLIPVETGGELVPES